MSVQDELRKLYREYNAVMNTLATGLIEKVIAYIDGGMLVSQAIDKALAEARYFSKVDKAIEDSIFRAACIGYGVMPGDADKKAITDIALEKSWLPDKMKLSTRLHGKSRAMRQAIIDAVQNGFRLRKSLTEIRNDLYDGYNSGKRTINSAKLPNYLQKLVQQARVVGAVPADIEKALTEAKAKFAKLEKNNAWPTREMRETYKQLIDAAEKLDRVALENSVKSAIEEKSRFYADRIAQTEQSRAAREGFVDKHSQNEDVFGFRWLLNTAHKAHHFDICDFLAAADFGYGKGVYPKDKLPRFPAHPFCRCYFAPVYNHQIPDGATLNMEAPRDFINSLPDDKKRQLLTIDGAKAFNNGADWQSFLVGWQGFEKPVNRFKGVIK